MNRAEESFAEAKIMARENHWNSAINRLYYTCFYAASALIKSRGLDAAKHSGVRAIFGKQFVKTGIFPKDLASVYYKLFEFRQKSDYEDLFTANSTEVQSWIPGASKFVEKATEILSNS